MQLRLERFFDAATLARGMGYLRDGRIIALSVIGADGRLDARVRGSGRQVYSLQIWLRLDRKGNMSDLAGACSCPVGARCKHMAAALMAFQLRIGMGETALPDTALPDTERPAAAPPAAPAAAPLPYPVQQWLTALAHSMTPAVSDGYPATVRDRLVYVLDWSAGALRVTVMKSSLTQGSGLSDRATRYDLARLKRQSDDRPQFIRQSDLELLRDLEAAGVALNGNLERQERWRPKFLEPEAPDLWPLLQRLAETGRARWGERDGAFLRAGDPGRVVFRWLELENGAQELQPCHPETGIRLQLLPLARPVWLDPATGIFGLLDSDLSLQQLQALCQAPRLSAAIAAEVAARLSGLPGLPGAAVPLPKALGLEVRQGRNPVPVLRLFGLKGQAIHGEGWRQLKEKVVQPALRLAFDYGGPVAPAHHAEALQFREDAVQITLQRDLAAEMAAHRQLEGCGALPPETLNHHQFGKQAQAHDRVFVDGEWDPETLDVSEARVSALQFLGERVPELRAAGWRVEVDADWPLPLADVPVQIEAQIGAATAGGWFDFGLTVRAGDHRVDLAPLIADILQSLPPDLPDVVVDGPDFEALVAATPSYLALDDGRHIRLETRQLTEILRVMLRSTGLIHRLHAAEAGQLATLAEGLEGCGVPFTGGTALIELGHRLQALSQPEAFAPPAGLKAVLRPYQALGYNWLVALSETGFGGLLADDMGLGKTLQTLALLAQRHLEGRAEQPSLLIVPTSLARAWERQAAQFVPDLQVLVLQGKDRRALFDRIDTAHLVISTYPLLHRDHELLCARAWDVVILDEAQAVKNPAAAVARRIRDLQGRMRLALTGTPMENTLTDLWALFDWLVPGLLGDRKRFATEVVQPVERDGNRQVQAQLNRRLKPFMLRRSKDQVALDLPARTEITEYIPLGTRQQALYETVRMAMDARVRDAIAARGVQGAQITILDALLKMRQACCDPTLLKDAARIGESAKRDRLLEMLDALVQEGRKVLVFSQFVEMLRLIEADVKSRGWSYAMLTGQTVQRDAVIDAFQSGEAQIFLISLKAGGVGLTLTAADTVILYDPWWNPAVERQAMDRAHRIGQTRAVFVYRLVAEGTVEEAILHLQARKQALADALLDGTVTGDAPFSAADVAALFGR